MGNPRQGALILAFAALAALAGQSYAFIAPLPGRMIIRRHAADGAPTDTEREPKARTADVDESQDDQGEESVSPMEYFLGQEGEFEADLRRAGVSRKRLLTNVGAAAALALGANFLGVTSSLLSLAHPQLLDSTQLDRLYPVRGFYRYTDGDDGYEFKYPKSWLQDQALVLAEATERSASLGEVGMGDPLAQFRPTKITEGKRRASVFRPDVAFGPPGGGYEENVSVVKAKVPIGASLESLGGPAEVAAFVLDTTVAPAGSGKNATLVSATSEVRQPGGVVYQLEYVVRKPGRFALRNVCAITTRPSEGELYTLVALAPEEKWREREAEIRQIVKSFRLTRP